ncbi:MAG: twin-arginine translocase TatA/TatE family subunit [Chitinispirillaceae bacterium]|jgi:sec-independent protein translocase protein TatA
MGTFSPFHWIIVLLVLVLLFGAKKIPELAKGLGLGLKEFKKAMKEEEKAPDAQAKDPGTIKPENKDVPKV